MASRPFPTGHRAQALPYRPIGLFTHGAAEADSLGLWALCTGPVLALPAHIPSPRPSVTHAWRTSLRVKAALSGPSPASEVRRTREKRAKPALATQGCTTGQLSGIHGLWARLYKLCPTSPVLKGRKALLTLEEQGRFNGPVGPIKPRLLLPAMSFLGTFCPVLLPAQACIHGGVFGTFY